MSGTLVSWDLSARHYAAGRPSSVRLELHQLDSLRILGLLGATTALDPTIRWLRIAWLKGHVEQSSRNGECLHSPGATGECQLSQGLRLGDRDSDSRTCQPRAQEAVTSMVAD